MYLYYALTRKTRKTAPIIGNKRLHNLLKSTYRLFTVSVSEAVSVVSVTGDKGFISSCLVLNKTFEGPAIFCSAVTWGRSGHSGMSNKRLKSTSRGLKVKR